MTCFKCKPRHPPAASLWALGEEWGLGFMSMLSLFPPQDNNTFFSMRSAGKNKGRDQGLASPVSSFRKPCQARRSGAGWHLRCQDVTKQWVFGRSSALLSGRQSLGRFGYKRQGWKERLWKFPKISKRAHRQVCSLAWWADMVEKEGLFGCLFQGRVQSRSLWVWWMHIKTSSVRRTLKRIPRHFSELPFSVSSSSSKLEESMATNPTAVSGPSA